MHRALRQLLIIIFIALCAMPYAPGSCFADDQIIAIINNDIITKKNFDEYLGFLHMQLAREFSGKELESKVQATKVALLQEMIEDRLILQEAKRAGLRIDEERVRARISEIKKRFPGDAEFQADLAKQGLTEADLGDKIREQMMKYFITEINVTEKIIIRPEEVSNYYNQNIKDITSGEEREVMIIALENADQAKSFSYNFRRGEKLEDLATRYPITVNRIKAVRGQDLRREIEEIVFRLTPGEASDPVNLEDKYYCFKVENIVPSRQLSLVEAQEKIHSILLEKKRQEMLVKWIEGLKQQSYVKILQH